MKIKNKVIYEYLMISIGSFILAIAISMFFERKELITGGVTGFAIVAQYLTQETAFPMLFG